MSVDSSFVCTPLGVVMHVDNHRHLVRMCSKGMRKLLEPAVPVLLNFSPGTTSVPRGPSQDQ